MVRAAKYKKGGRVKCLATRFGIEENKGSQGRLWSKLHKAKGETKWYRGVIQLLIGGRKLAGNYKAKYDGGSRGYTSNESHLEPRSAVGEDSDGSDTPSGSDDDDIVNDSGSVDTEGVRHTTSYHDHHHSHPHSIITATTITIRMQG